DQFPAVAADHGGVAARTEEALPEALFSRGVPAATDGQPAAVWTRPLPSGAHSLGAGIQFPPTGVPQLAPGAQCPRFLLGIVDDDAAAFAAQLHPDQHAVGDVRALRSSPRRGVVVEPLGV